MALIFQRLARNFIKNGYFPTDEASISRICRHARTLQRVLTRIFDPAAVKALHWPNAPRFNIKGAQVLLQALN